MLRGSEISTVLPVVASMLATVSESGRSPQRPAPASPPEQQHVEAAVRGAGGVAVAEHRDDEVALHADQVGAEEQRPRDREAQQAVDADDRAPVLNRRARAAAPAATRRRRGRPSRWRAPSAPAGRPRAARCWRRPRRRTGARAGEAPTHAVPTTTSASQIRIATRPTSRLPATSCAEPGTTSVITISATARRKRTRAARSSGRRRADPADASGCWPGVGRGMRGGASRCSGKEATWRQVSPVTPVTAATTRRSATRAAWRGPPTVLATSPAVRVIDARRRPDGHLTCSPVASAR